MLRRSVREWTRDVFVTACALLIGMLVLAGSRDAQGSVPGWANVREAVLGGAAMLVLLLFRRERPMATALFLTVWSLTSSVGWGATVMAVFGVAVHRPWRPAFLVAGLNCALILASFLGLPADLTTRERLESVTVFVLGYLLILATGLLVRSRRQLVESLRARAREAEEGQRLRIEEARHLERERIAREMHDVLAHRISLLAVHAGALEFRPDTPEEHREAVGIIRRSAYEAMEDLRDVIGVLRSPGSGDDPERPQPTLADVPALVREARAAGGLIELDDRVPAPAAVPDRVGRHAYRIVQEGLTNARKHAPDEPVRVVLEASKAGRELTIEIENATTPGRVPALPGGGAGLLGLGERVTLLGGTLVHGAAGGRFRLRARLPL
ncbi:sensor histidine kinase [Actinomadura algeriensis]|nr:histidine kinase [Actinomadura algeriensis]